MGIILETEAVKNDGKEEKVKKSGRGIVTSSLVEKARV